MYNPGPLPCLEPFGDDLMQTRRRKAVRGILSSEAPHSSRTAPADPVRALIDEWERVRVKRFGDLLAEPTFVALEPDAGTGQSYWAALPAELLAYILKFCVTEAPLQPILAATDGLRYGARLSYDRHRKTRCARRQRDGLRSSPSPPPAPPPTLPPTPPPTPPPTTPPAPPAKPAPARPRPRPHPQPDHTPNPTLVSA